MMRGVVRPVVPAGWQPRPCHAPRSRHRPAPRTRRPPVRCDSAPNNPDPDVDWRLTLYDNLLKQQAADLQESRAALDELRAGIDKAKEEGWPDWVSSAAEWCHGYGTGLLVQRQKVYKDLVVERETLAAGLPTDAKSDASLTNARAVEAQIQELFDEDAGGSAIGIAFGAALSCLTITWLAGLGGVEAGSRLVNVAQWNWGTASSWAAFTIPYVAGTIALSVVSPQLAANRGVLRSFHIPEVFQLPAVSLASLAAAIGYSRTVVWQGAFLNGLTGALGGNPTQAVVDSSLMVDDRVASSLGGLVMTQQLPLLLVAPTVVVAVAACEAAAFVLAEFGGKAQMDGMASGASVAWKAVAEEEKAAGGANARLAELEPDWTNIVFQQRQEMPEGELVATAARIAVSSMWLSTETLVTSNLWLAVGTSAAGMLVAMVLAGGRAGATDRGS